MPNVAMRVSDKVGFWGLWLFSFSAFLSTSGAVLGYVMFFVALFFTDSRWRQWLYSPIVILSLSFGLYITARAIFAASNLPEASSEIWDKWIAWIKLLLFIPFGYWVYRKPEWRQKLLLVSVLGLVIGMLFEVEWADPLQFLSTRSGYQFPAIGFAYVAGIALIGLGLLGATSRKSGAVGVNWFGWFLFGLLFLVLFQGFIQSYSRGAWLAMIVSLFVLAMSWLGSGKKDPTVAKQVVTVGVLFLALFSIVAMLNQERIQERLAYETDLFEQILTEEGDTSEVSSTTLRLNLWAYGIEKIYERPLFGWGPGTTKYLVAHSGMPERLKNQAGKWLPHLHNAYIDMGVQLGLFGIVWGGLILFFMGRTVIKTSKVGVMPRNYVLFFLGVFVFALVWSLFDYRTVHRDWRFSWILVAGTLFSFYLEQILDKRKTAGAKVATD